MHPRSSVWFIALAWLSFGCGDDGYQDPPIWDAAPRDARIDAAPPDAAPMPDRPISLEGPSIVIQTPVAQALLSDVQVEVTALVSDPDGVDTTTVLAVIAGGFTFSLTRSGASPDLYTGLVDLRTVPTGTMQINVQGADLLGNLNSATVEVQRDTGPIITFLNPEDGARFAGALNLDFLVSDPFGVDEASVTAVIGNVPLAVVKRSEDTEHGAVPQWIEFSYEILFDDPMFVPALAGEQQIAVTAANLEHSVSATGTVTMVVDDEGPAIVLVSPQPGEIVGGIIDIEAEVSDEAGVLTTSVKAVLGNSAQEFTVDLAPVGNLWHAAFDTRLLPRHWVFPTLSVRAADVLNNESSVGYLISLDNTPPILSLDPPEDFRIGRVNAAGLVECSWQLDPVGVRPDATDIVRTPRKSSYLRTPNDLETVPQVFYLWTRIEDQGNSAVGLVQVPVSLVEPASVFVYVLDDTTRPLVIDTDGDGFCDEINPELTPTTNPQTGDEVLALNLVAVEPTGAADFSFGDPTDATTLTTGWLGCQAGPPDEVFPARLCPTVLPTIVIGYTATRTEPAIYTVPPLDIASQTHCIGNQFDSLAANVQEGWACVAVRAVDNAGNIGVSVPIRVCIDYDFDPDVTTPCPVDEAPDCTGTQNQLPPQEITTQPCQFDAKSQTFPAREVRIYH